MEVEFWDANWPAYRTAPVPRDEIIARAIYDISRGEDWVWAATRIAPPPDIGGARAVRRQRLIDRVVVTVRCSRAAFAAVEQWVEHLVESGFHGGPIPRKLPPPRHG